MTVHLVLFLVDPRNDTRQLENVQSGGDHQLRFRPYFHARQRRVDQVLVKTRFGHATEGTIRSTLEEAAITTIIDITNQTTGNEETITVPTHHVYLPNFIAVKLVTDATVPVRQLTVEVLDAGANVIYTADAAATQAASLTVTYFVHPAGDPILPIMQIPAAAAIRFFLSSNPAAGDDITLRGSVINSG